jgi:hypothetical protein
MELPFPRPLRLKEQDLLESVLPFDRPGYKDVRQRLRSMLVIAQGRRGAGNIILGYHGRPADLTMPLPPVIAYGAVETTRGTFTISVGEIVDDQMDVEIVSGRSEEIPDYFEEKRRWTYSTWSPGQVSPATGAPVREVTVGTGLVLAVSRREKRLWIHDRSTGMVHLIPVTNFYNELMIHQHIRDPRVALAPARLFEDLDRHSDIDLRSAFVSSNAMKRRVVVDSVQREPEPKFRTLFRHLFSR